MESSTSYVDAMKLPLKELAEVFEDIQYFSHVRAQAREEARRAT